MEVVGKYDVLQMAARLVKGFAERHRHQFQMGRQAIELGSGQRGEKMVLLWAIGRGHQRAPELWSRLQITCDFAVTDRPPAWYHDEKPFCVLSVRWRTHRIH